MRPIKFLVLAALAFAISVPAAARPADAPAKIAVFKFELLDTSGGPPRGEAERLELITAILRDRLDQSARYDVVPIELARLEGLPNARLAPEGTFSDCRGCEVPLAAALGADRSLVGLVQKVSNLIININVYIRDTATGELLAAHSVDIRGNTDGTWKHGISYLIRNRLLK